MTYQNLSAHQTPITLFMFPCSPYVPMPMLQDKKKQGDRRKKKRNTTFWCPYLSQIKESHALAKLATRPERRHVTPETFPNELETRARDIHSQACKDKPQPRKQKGRKCQ